MDECKYKNKIDHIQTQVDQQQIRNTNTEKDISEIKSDIKDIRIKLTNGFLEKKIQNSIEQYIGKLTIKLVLSSGVAGAAVSYIVSLIFNNIG
jgi:hypothetical protein